MRLIEQLRWWAAECDRTNFGCQARKLLLEAAEALEKAEPVVHGEWRIAERDMAKHTVLVECSECDALLDLPMTAFGLNYDYCPNCGAKMDGGE